MPNLFKQSRWPVSMRNQIGACYCSSQALRFCVWSDVWVHFRLFVRWTLLFFGGHVASGPRRAVWSDALRYVSLWAGKTSHTHTHSWVVCWSVFKHLSFSLSSRGVGVVKCLGKWAARIWSRTVRNRPVMIPSCSRVTAVNHVLKVTHVHTNTHTDVRVCFFCSWWGRTNGKSVMNVVTACVNDGNIWPELFLADGRMMNDGEFGWCRSVAGWSRWSGFEFRLMSRVKHLLTIIQSSGTAVR